MHRGNPYPENASQDGMQLGSTHDLQAEWMEAENRDPKLLTGMTNREINERVAKLCEWYREIDSLGNVTWCKHGEYRPAPPNYSESLDACREFEKEYTFGEQEDVFDALYDKFGCRGACFATPFQRCEAFLRLKGKWE
jgi:hypothetical protein